MNCPACGKTLRALQVEKMFGNPDFNEWCRNGYCSSECYEGDDQKEPQPELVPRKTSMADDAGKRCENKQKVFRSSSRAYDLASICLVSAPFAIAVSFLSNIPFVGEIVGLIIWAIIPIGFLSGICALFSIPKLGPQRLLWKSLVGLAMIGFLVWALIYAIATANV